MNTSNIQVSLGYDGCDFDLVEEDTIVMLQGAFITLWNTTTGKKDYIQCPRQNGYAMICTSHNNNLIAASEYGLQPECHVYQMPSKQVIAQFSMQTTLRSSAMSFSRCGGYLLIVGGVPDFTISIYDIKNQNFIKTPTTKLPFKHTQLRGAHFNPRSHEQFAIASDSKIYFYRLKHAFMRGEQQQQQTFEDGEEGQAFFELKESFRYDVGEFSTSDVPCSPDEEPVVFGSFKWDMWNRVHLCTNKTQVLQISSHDTPKLEHSLEVNSVPLTTLMTQRNIIVSTEDGMFTWYRVEQPIENSDGSVTNEMALHMLDQVDAEYNFLEFKNKATNESDENQAGYPATFLKYSKSYNRIILGTQNGILAKVEIVAEKVEEEEEEPTYANTKGKQTYDAPLTILGRFHTAPISGIRELANSTQFVTISEDNTMAIWEATTQQQLCMVPMHDRPVSLCVNTTGMAAFIGTEGGAFLAYDVSNRFKPRLVYQTRFFERYIPLDLMYTSLNGELILLSSTESDQVFVTSQKGERDFTIFGFIKMAGILRSISFLTKDGALWVGAILSNNLLQVCKLPTDRCENRKDPIPDSETLTTYRKVDPGTNRVMTSALTNRIFVTGEDKYLKQYDSWPVDTYDNLDWRKPANQPNDEYISHSIGTSCVHWSLSHKKMATGGKDGLVIVRDPTNVRNLKEFQTHSVVGGGVSQLCLSEQYPCFFVAGVDGSILVVSIDDSTYPTSQVMPQPSQELAHMEEQVPRQIQEMQLFTDVMQLEFQKANEERKELFKKKIMEQLLVIQKKLRDLLTENQHVTDIEMLERFEFVIDQGREKQFLDEGDNVCIDIRKEAERTNLKLELLKDRIVQSTWDKMDVPSTALKSIQNDSLVHNFSIRKKTPLEQKTMLMLVNQRKIELLEKYRRIESKLNECLSAADFATDKEGYFMNRKAGKPKFMTDDAIALAAEEFERRDREKKLARMKTEQVQQTNKGEEGKRKPYLKITKGRLGTKIRKKDDGELVVVQQMERDIQGMESRHWKVVYDQLTLEELVKALEAPMPNIYDLLYEAFELYTDQRKRSQIEMIKEVIFELKRDFNDEFKALQNEKQEELFKIQEKMEAIQELQTNLGQEVDKFEPKTHELEDPKRIFKIDPSEIKVEKYLTQEDKDRIAEEERKRLEREAKLKGDTVGTRGIKIMMGGELIFKKEKTSAEFDIPKEDWMNKPDEEMTDDERARYKEWLQKEKEFKDKQRKAWEFNLKNIRNEIIDIEYRFEEKFLELNKKRLFYEHRIYEQELYIIRLIIMMHEGRETRSSQHKYTEELDNLRAEYEEKKVFLQNCYDQMQDFQKQIANDQAERKQIAELEKYCRDEQLVKKDYIEFIQKGKPQCRVQVPVEQRQQMKAHIVDLDPFATIDHLAVNETIKKMEQKEVYDFERDRPGPSIVQEQFNKIVEQRNIRLRMDKQKESANKRLNNLKEFIKWYESNVTSLQEQCDTVANKERKTINRIEKLKYNFEVIIYLKQGQVEVPQLPVATDYKDAILIQKQVIDGWNDQIIERGNLRVNNLTQILRHSTLLKQVQCTNRKILLQITDFKERAKDVQLYRVTKQTQEIIQGKHVKKEEEDKKNIEKQTNQLKVNAEKRINAINGQIAKLRMTIKDRTQENEQLEQKARDLKSQVEQRYQITSLKSNNNQSSENDPRKKIQDIANQRKLLDVIKQQEEEIMFLKDELDRLRARTFPSFAHLQNKMDHPDNRM